MDNLLGQFSYPVFLYLLWVFFLIVSVFGLVVGLGLMTRSAVMFRLFESMNRWVSVRKMMKPLSTPYFIEPALMKRPAMLGMMVIPGATTAVVLLNDIPAEIFQPVFLGPMSYGSAVVLSQYTKDFLLIGNGICVLVGLLLLFAPRLLSRLENYADMWYSVRKRTQTLSQMHIEVDQWVLAHPTVSGITLTILSFGLGSSMYARL